MNLTEFQTILAEHPEKGIDLRLPDDSSVPAHFHITEVGSVSKTFLDCGGKSHSETSCVLQVWVADDFDHRIKARKLAGVLKRGQELFESPECPVEFEHECPVLTRMPINSHDVNEENIVFKLHWKKADCLAKDLCLPKRDFSLPDIPSGMVGNEGTRLFSFPRNQNKTS